MTIKKLIKILKQFDQNTIVDLSSDPEGNNYGSISKYPSEGRLTTGEEVIVLYPYKLFTSERYSE